MSCDFRLIKPKPGVDPLEIAHSDSEEIRGQPDPEKELLKHKVAEALVARNPQLVPFKFNHEAIALKLKISVAEAQIRFRHVELSNPGKDTNGILISLFDDEASVTVPYWHNGERADAVFREIWGYLEILRREAGYLVFDPQLDCILDPAADCADSVACYAGGVDMRSKIIAAKSNQSQKPAAKNKPWWKLW